MAELPQPKQSKAIIYEPISDTRHMSHRWDIFAATRKLFHRWNSYPRRRKWSTGGLVIRPTSKLSHRWRNCCTGALLLAGNAPANTAAFVCLQMGNALQMRARFDPLCAKSQPVTLSDMTSTTTPLVSVSVVMRETWAQEMESLRAELSAAMEPVERLHESVCGELQPLSRASHSLRAWIMFTARRPLVGALVRALLVVARASAWTRVPGPVAPDADDLPSAPSVRPRLVPRGPNPAVTHGAPFPGFAQSDVAA